jgi:hypothetical protein
METRTVCVSKHVQFDETCFPFKHKLFPAIEPAQSPDHVPHLSILTSISNQPIPTSSNLGAHISSSDQVANSTQNPHAIFHSTQQPLSNPN